MTSYYGQNFVKAFFPYLGISFNLWVTSPSDQKLNEMTRLWKLDLDLRDGCFLKTTLNLNPVHWKLDLTKSSVVVLAWSRKSLSFPFIPGHSLELRKGPVMSLVGTPSPSMPITSSKVPTLKSSWNSFLSHRKKCPVWVNFPVWVSSVRATNPLTTSRNCSVPSWFG